MQKLEPLQNSATTFFLFFALLWNGITGAIGCGIFFSVTSDNNQGIELAAILTLLPFLGIGMIFMLLAIRSSLGVLKAPNANVLISGNPLMLGDAFTVNYQQRFRGGVTLNSIRYDLIFRESATYTQGTNTYTVHHDVVMNSFEMPAQRLSGGEPLQTQLSFQVPPSAMHSFHANNNKLRWIIRAKIGIEGWPDYEREYEFAVLPLRRESITQGFS